MKMLVLARKALNTTALTAIKKTLGALDKLKSATAVGAILEQDQGKLVRRLFKDEIEMDSLLECFWPNEPNLNPLKSAFWTHFLAEVAYNMPLPGPGENCVAMTPADVTNAVFEVGYLNAAAAPLPRPMSPVPLLL